MSAADRWCVRSSIRNRAEWFYVRQNGTGRTIAGKRGGMAWFQTREAAKSVADEMNGKPRAPEIELIEAPR